MSCRGPRATPTSMALPQPSQVQVRVQVQVQHQPSRFPVVGGSHLLFSALADPPADLPADAAASARVAAERTAPVVCPRPRTGAGATPASPPDVGSGRQATTVRTSSHQRREA